METDGCTSDHKDMEEFEKKPDSFVNSDNSDGEEDYDNEDDFTFACVGDDNDDATSFSAEDMFDNGKIRPVFPLFDQSLVFMPPVKNIFLETCDAPSPLLTAEATEQQQTGEEAGPYCSWSRKAVQMGPASSPDSCKKSNSTGFSKIWRFKEMSNRSHSDGRDAFVFLNKPTPEKKPKDSAAAVAGSRDSLGFLDKLALEKKSKDSLAIARRKTSGSDDRESNRESKDSAAAAARGKKASGISGRDTVGAGGERERAAAAMAAKKKGGGKGKTVASAHEVYVKSRAATREEDRRRSYLPYKPELVGFFTNVHGGMSKNVHPF